MDKLRAKALKSSTKTQTYTPLLPFRALSVRVTLTRTATVTRQPRQGSDTNYHTEAIQASPGRMHSARGRLHHIMVTWVSTSRTTSSTGVAPRSPMRKSSASRKAQGLRSNPATTRPTACRYLQSTRRNSFSCISQALSSATK